MQALSVMVSRYLFAEFRRLATSVRTTAGSQWMLSLTPVLAGTKRAEAASAGGMDRQTLKDWFRRFNAEGPEGLCSKPGLDRSVSAERGVTAGTFCYH